MKPIKLKDLLTQTKKPETQQIEIMEDCVLSVKAVFEGAVKDVPEDMLSKYYISDWYVRDETTVLVVLVWTNPHEQLSKYVENLSRNCHSVTIHDLMGNGCCTNPYIDFAIVNIKTGEVLVDRVHDRTYFDEEVFCGNPKEVPECYASKKVTEWTTSDNLEIVLYVN